MMGNGYAGAVEKWCPWDKCRLCKWFCTCVICIIMCIVKAIIISACKVQLQSTFKRGWWVSSVCWHKATGWDKNGRVSKYCTWYWLKWYHCWYQPNTFPQDVTFVSHRPPLFLKYENMNFVLSAFPNLLLLSEKGKCMKVAYTLRNGIQPEICLSEA